MLGAYHRRTFEVPNFQDNWADLNLIYKINRSGPKIVPWGIPKARDLLSEIELLTTHF